VTAVAVVFDCDGVLVDSEPHSIVSWLDVLSGVGHPAGASDVEACAGLGFAPTYGSLSEIAPLPPPDEVFPILLAALRRSFSRGLRRFPDTVAVLNACIAAGFPVAVASSSPRARLELTLEMAGIAGLIGVSVARYFDGMGYSDCWALDLTPTFGAVNDGPGCSPQPDIVLNEVIPVSNSSSPSLISVSPV